MVEVASEWCRAVQDAADAPRGAGHKPGWHVFADDGPRAARSSKEWYSYGTSPGLHRSDWDDDDLLPSGRDRDTPWPVRGVSPLEVTIAQWTRGIVSQSSPFPGGANVLSVTFSANVPLGPAQVRNHS